MFVARGMVSCLTCCLVLLDVVLVVVLLLLLLLARVRSSGPYKYGDVIRY